MSYDYQDSGQPGENWQRVNTNEIDARVSFIRKTYAHLFAAILAFVGLEVAFFQSGMAQTMTEAMLGTSWLLVLGLFMVVGWVADWWAQNQSSKAMQYLGLTVYVLAESVLFVPLLFIASTYSDPLVIPTAGILTLAIFSGLTVSVFVTKKDFSWMRSGLAIASFATIGIIICAVLFGFTLGLFFSIAMVLLASAWILYQTSNVLHHYHTDQHVAASLALFSSVALLFWYVLRILMLSND